MCRHVANMLLTLGHDGAAASSVFTCLGWYKDTDRGGHHVYLAPAGSVTAAGPTDAYTVGAPAGSEDGALNAAAASIGHPAIPQDPEGIRKAAKSLTAFMAITPGRPDVSAATLGALMAAPLALSGRTTVLLTANPGVGKSFLMGAVCSFITPVMDGKTFTGGALMSATKVGVEVASAWARHSLVGWDDFKDAGDEAENKKIRTATNAALTQAFGASGAPAGTQAGGARRSRSSKCVGIMTAEGTPSGTGFQSRAVRIVLNPGDVAITPKGTSGYDRFRDEYAFTGKTRELFGAYLQWLAARIDQVGLTAFTRDNDQALWLTSAAGRSAEAVGTLAVGWVRFLEFATEKGFADLLPAQDVIDSLLSSLVFSNVEAVEGQNPALAIIEAVRDALQARAGYLEPADGSIPTGDLARSLGWAQREVRDMGVIRTEWVPGNFRLGFLATDEMSVTISGEAISRFKKSTGYAFTPKDQLTRAAEALVVPGTVPGDRGPGSGFPARNRGWVVPAGLLDLGAVPVDVEPVVVPAPSTAPVALSFRAGRTSEEQAAWDEFLEEPDFS
jgi:hypothetical protein